MSEPLARASFDTTAEERADVACRVSEMSTTVRRTGRIVIVLTLAAFALALFVVLRWATPDGSWQGPAALTATSLVIAGATLPRYLPRAQRRAVQKILAETYGDGPLRFVVELHPDRVVGDCGRHALSVPWSEVRTVRDAGGDVEIKSGDALIVVRARAFATPAAAATFRDAAERLRAGAAPPGAR